MSHFSFMNNSLSVHYTNTFYRQLKNGYSFAINENIVIATIDLNII